MQFFLVRCLLSSALERECNIILKMRTSWQKRTLKPVVVPVRPLEGFLRFSASRGWKDDVPGICILNWFRVNKRQFFVFVAVWS